MKFIGEYWRGEKPLWKAFWLGLIYSFLLSVITSLILVVAYAAYQTAISKENNSDSSLYIVSIVCFFALIAFIWWSVAVWRSSRMSKTVWKILARVFILYLLIDSIFGLTSFASEHGFDCLINIECLEKLEKEISAEKIKEQNGN